MKIAFVTASLDPGRDGVGDYTRRLAQACVECGHSVCLLALNEAPDAGASGARERTPELRMNSSVPWAQRINQGRRFLEEERPDFVSLQFVCYGYSPNGICLNLAQRLELLADSFHTHVMFHELWIGHWRNATLKERLVGAAQKSCIAALLRRLRPIKIHTSIQRYVELLGEAGFRAEALPLFGNIPISPPERGAWLGDELRRNDIDISGGRRSEVLLAGIFGTLHPNWPPEPLLSQLADIRGRRPVLVSIGRMGAGRELWRRLRESYTGRIEFVALGERSPEQISQFLQTIDAGIATSPFEVCGKSGTVAALLEHGCPVIVNWHEQPTGPGVGEAAVPDPFLHLLTPDFEFLKLRRRPPQARLPEVAEIFLKSLKATPVCVGA